MVILSRVESLHRPTVATGAVILSTWLPFLPRNTNQTYTRHDLENNIPIHHSTTTHQSRVEIWDARERTPVVTPTTTMIMRTEVEATPSLVVVSLTTATNTAAALVVQSVVAHLHTHLLAAYLLVVCRHADRWDQQVLKIGGKVCMALLNRALVWV